MKLPISTKATHFHKPRFSRSSCVTLVIFCRRKNGRSHSDGSPQRRDIYALVIYIVNSCIRLSEGQPGQCCIKRVYDSQYAQGLSIFTLLFLVSRVLVGPPPESVAVIGPHTADSIVIVSNLPMSITDAQLKKECIELLSRPRFIYMHVGDLKSGTFSGTAVIEFSDKESAAKAVSVGVAGGRARYVNEQEFISLTSGEWPMLEYGPAQGVFQFQPKPSVPVAAAPSWAQPGRGPVANPWQK